MAEFLPGRQGASPGTIPHFDGAPTVADLPSESGTGEPLSLLYFNVSAGVYAIATPDGSGGIVTNTFLDVSGDVSLGGL